MLGNQATGSVVVDGPGSPSSEDFEVKILRPGFECRLLSKPHLDWKGTCDERLNMSRDGNDGGCVESSQLLTFGLDLLKIISQAFRAALNTVAFVFQNSIMAYERLKVRKNYRMRHTFP